MFVYQINKVRDILRGIPHYFHVNCNIDFLSVRGMMYYRKALILQASLDDSGMGEMGC